MGEKKKKKKKKKDELSQCATTFRKNILGGFTSCRHRHHDHPGNVAVHGIDPNLDLENQLLQLSFKIKISYKQYKISLYARNCINIKRH